MKPLPTLAVDCRDKTINDPAYAGVQVITDVVKDKPIALVRPDDTPQGFFSNASEIVHRCNAYPDLVQRLRFFAIEIIEAQKPAQARVEYDGYRCMCCGSRWPLLGVEVHGSECVLKDTANGSAAV